MWRDTSCKPHVTTDDAVMSYDGFSSQYRRSRIYHHIVLQGGVAFLYSVILTYTERPEGNTLIDLHVISNHRSFADDHARAMVDAKMIAVSGRRVNVDAGFTVCTFRYDPRYTLNSEDVELVSYAVRR